MHTLILVDIKVREQSEENMARWVTKTGARADHKGTTHIRTPTLHVAIYRIQADPVDGITTPSPLSDCRRSRSSRQSRRRRRRASPSTPYTISPSTISDPRTLLVENRNAHTANHFRNSGGIGFFARGGVWRSPTFGGHRWKEATSARARVRRQVVRWRREWWVVEGRKGGLRCRAREPLVNLGSTGSGLFSCIDYITTTSATHDRTVQVFMLQGAITVQERGE